VPDIWVRSTACDLLCGAEQKPQLLEPRDPLAGFHLRRHYATSFSSTKPFQRHRVGSATGRCVPTCALAHLSRRGMHMARVINVTTTPSRTSKQISGRRLHVMNIKPGPGGT
jgi:hypothetical protein